MMAESTHPHGVIRSLGKCIMHPHLGLVLQSLCLVVFLWIPSFLAVHSRFGRPNVDRILISLKCVKTLLALAKSVSVAGVIGYSFGLRLMSLDHLVISKTLL